jgi:hypothetical protein
MSEIASNPALIPWIHVVILGFAGELTGFRGSALFISLPGMLTAICVATLPDFSVAEQVLSFALLFACHALISHFLSPGDSVSTTVESADDGEANTGPF